MTIRPTDQNILHAADYLWSKRANADPALYIITQMNCVQKRPSLLEHVQGLRARKAVHEVGGLIVCLWNLLTESEQQEAQP